MYVCMDICVYIQICIKKCIGDVPIYLFYFLSAVVPLHLVVFNVVQIFNEVINKQL